MDRPADIVCDALVVGGGAAGIAAAVELSRAGLGVGLAEQRPALGGAYHRQPTAGAARTQTGKGRTRRWARLENELQRTGVTPHLSHVFLGVDSDGLVLLDDRASGRVLTVRARALIVAVGAVERVRPRPGWHLNGVMTAGGLQMLIKETGEAPRGDIVIAGNGPLTMALAADLVRLGRPPVAVVEAGNPFSRLGAALRMTVFPGLVAEAIAQLMRVRASGTPWLRGSRLTSITREGGHLVASMEDGSGATRQVRADIIALHDGIRPNDFGLPEKQARGEFVVLRAGDCREALGIGSAEADGRAAAREAVALLSGAARHRETHEVLRQRRAQAVLADLFRPVRADGGLAALPDDTVLCRCEGRTAGELRAILAEPDPVGLREIKLNGRFGMGLCQGRFCADNVQALVSAARPAMAAGRLSRDRWPARPVQIAALAAEEEPRGE